MCADISGDRRPDVASETVIVDQLARRNETKQFNYFLLLSGAHVTATELLWRQLAGRLRLVTCAFVIASGGLADRPAGRYCMIRPVDALLDR